MQVVCSYCGNEFRSYSSRLRKGKGKYCTPRCCSNDRKRPDAERFWSHVEKTDGCWLWSGFTTDFGYGMAWMNNKNESAHRAAYRLLKGQIPAGMFVLHTCDVPRCVNPDHLYVGTPKDNSHDMVIRGRSARGDRNGARLHPERKPRGDQHWSHKCPERVLKGQRHPNARLTERQVLNIRQMAYEGHRMQSIADIMGVTRQAVRLVVLRINWKHLLNDELESEIGATNVMAVP